MSALERHHSVFEIAEMWKVSADTVRRLFTDEPGVVKIGKPETRFKRKRYMLRIPESVVIRVHSRILSK